MEYVEQGDTVYLKLSRLEYTAIYHSVVTCRREEASFIRTLVEFNPFGPVAEPRVEAVCQCLRTGLPPSETNTALPRRRGEHYNWPARAIGTF